jgi:hypothetical protein
MSRLGTRTGLCADFRRCNDETFSIKGRQALSIGAWPIDLPGWRLDPQAGGRNLLMMLRETHAPSRNSWIVLREYGLR